MPVWHDYQMLGDENHANQHMDSYPVSMEDLSSKIISWTQGIRTDADYLLWDCYFFQNIADQSARHSIHENLHLFTQLPWS